MFMQYVHTFFHSNLVWWIGVPMALIIILSLYSQFRKRRSTEN